MNSVALCPMPSTDSLDNEGGNIKLLFSASKSNCLLTVEIEFEM